MWFWLCVYRRFCRQKNILRNRVIGGLLTFCVAYIRLLEPFDLILTGQIAHYLNGHSNRSRRTDDYFAANLNEPLQAIEQPAIWITLTFDADLHTIDSDNNRDVNADKYLVNIGSRMRVFQ